MSEILRFSQVWGLDSFEVDFLKWYKNATNHKILPSFICWDIWKTENYVIFEDKLVNLVTNCLNLLSIYRDFSLAKVKVKMPKRVKKHQISLGETIYFDRATQFGFCGACIYIKINDMHNFTKVQTQKLSF